MSSENPATKSDNTAFLESIGGMSRNKLIELVKLQQEQLDTRMAATEVVRSGNEIKIPEDMSIQDAIKWLQRKDKDEEMVVSVRHLIQCHPLEGAVALVKAMKDLYGWNQNVPTPGFFGDTPPTMISVKVGTDEIIQVPWGDFIVQGIEGTLTTGYSSNAEGSQFIICGEIKKKCQFQLSRIIKRTEEILKTDSIYRNKALELDFSWMREKREFDPNSDGFKFIDIGTLTEDQLIFDTKTSRVLKTTLFSFLENAAALRANGIPLKRGVLLEGTYGVGKTLTAKMSAIKAIANGWTFVLVSDARDLDMAIRTARNYQPCVVFCEDIDKSVVEERTIEIDKILNTLDGIKSKNTEIVVVLTTNNVEKLTKAILRPGRIDSVVTLCAPDAEAASRLVKLYGNKLLSADLDYQKVGAELAGQIPAVIREVVERAKVTAVSMSGSASLDGVITTEALLFEVDAMRRHMNLMANKPVAAPVDNMSTALGKLITEHSAASMNGMQVVSNGKVVGKLEKVSSK